MVLVIFLMLRPALRGLAMARAFAIGPQKILAPPPPFKSRGTTPCQRRDRFSGHVFAFRYAPPMTSLRKTLLASLLALALSACTTTPKPDFLITTNPIGQPIAGFGACMNPYLYAYPNTPNE